jgi:hypothetical protein
VCILDADDTWAPTKLEKQNRVRTIVPLISVIGTGCNYFGDSTGSPQIPHGLISRGASLDYNPIINSSVLFKKEYAYWDESQGIQGIEDYDVWLRLDHAGVNMYNIDEKLTNHRLHKNSSFNNKTYDVPGLIARYRVLKW